MIELKREGIATRKKVLLLLLCALFAFSSIGPVLAASPTLSDISAHWAQQDIEKALESGWVNGYPDKSFQPDGTITKAEFVKLLMSAMHLTPDSETAKFLVENTGKDQIPSLIDMDSHWLTFQGWTLPAQSFGLIVSDDYSAHQFGPDTPITRYQTAVMVDRALGLFYPASQPVNESPSFVDWDKVPQWVKGYVKEATKAGVLEGYPDGSFGGERTATRAEAVVMVARAMQYMETGIDKEIKVTVKRDMDYGQYKEKMIDTLPAQMVDGRIYASVRSIFNAWSELGGSGIPPSTWDPIKQQVAFEFILESKFGAGDDRYENQAHWQGVNDYSPRLAAPARLLYGEIMIPVYDPSLAVGERGWLNSDWNPLTKTLVVNVAHPITPNS